MPVGNAVEAMTETIGDEAVEGVEDRQNGDIEDIDNQQQ